MQAEVNRLQPSMLNLRMNHGGIKICETVSVPGVSAICEYHPEEGLYQEE